MELKVIFPESARSDKRMVYKLTRAQSKRLQDSVGQEIFPVAWCLRDDVNSRNEAVTVLSMVDKEDEVHSTISATFIREFLVIAGLMEDDPYSIKVTEGTSKAGRPFISCTLV